MNCGKYWNVDRKGLLCLSGKVQVVINNILPGYIFEKSSFKMWNYTGAEKIFTVLKSTGAEKGIRIILQFVRLHLHPIVSFPSCRSWVIGNLSEGGWSPRGVKRGDLWACLLLALQSVSTWGVYGKSEAFCYCHRYVFISKR